MAESYWHPESKLEGEFDPDCRYDRMEAYKLGYEIPALKIEDTTPIREPYWKYPFITEIKGPLYDPVGKQPTGGPSTYYDMPYRDWVTTNDQMEWLAEHKWGKFAIHLKDIFKGLCRWGDKHGTDLAYDAKKIIYYGCRVYMMLAGRKALQDYLTELKDDKQFQPERKD